MPLPPAPTKRAALLSPDALDAPAHTSAKAPRRGGRAADDAQGDGPRALELFDERGRPSAGGRPAAPEAMQQIETKPRPAPKPEPTPQPVARAERAPAPAPTAPSPAPAVRPRAERGAHEAARPRRTKSSGP